MKQAVWLAAALMMLLPLGKVYSKERSERENNTLRIMSYNIRNGRGMDDVTDFRRTAAVINKVCPDVVAVQEIDSVTGRSGGKDVLREIAGLTLMHHMYAPAIDYDGGKYGIGMLSKEKPLGYRYLPLPGREEARALLVVEFEKYIYCCTHLSLTEEDRMLSLPVIRQVAASANKPFFIAGDMNAHPGSEFIRQLQNDFVILTDTKMPTFPAIDLTKLLTILLSMRKIRLPLPASHPVYGMSRPLPTTAQSSRILSSISLRARYSVRSPICKIL